MLERKSYRLLIYIHIFLLGVTVKVFVADLDTDTIHDPVSVRAYHTQTVDEFKNLVSQVGFMKSFVSTSYHKNTFILGRVQQKLSLVDP